MSYAGLILSGEKGSKSFLSFLSDDGLEVYNVEKNSEIVEMLGNHETAYLAVDVGSKESREEFTSEEEELKEEGHVFTPNSQAMMKVRRLEMLQRQVVDELGDGGPEFIRFEPYITADELSIHSDEGLNSLSINTDSINSSKEFDSVLGAVTARFYSEGQFEEKGVVIPEPLDSEQDEF